MDIIKGKLFIFGNNIDTDQIYPGRFIEITDHEEIAKHAMAGVDPSFASTVRPGDIVVGGTNFGCGSSREHAVIALKNARVGAVIAKSFARIFFRNAVNQGLIVIEAPNLDELDLNAGEEAELDVVNGEFAAGRGKIGFPPLPGNVLSIIEAGGIFKLFKKKGVKAFG
jgi:3-isopropylmalate dehydratase small subunit